MKKWQCSVCGFIYDEEEGLEEEGIAPGTRWEDIPEDWVCPECGVSKEDFEKPEEELSIKLDCDGKAKITDDPKNKKPVIEKGDTDF